VKLSSRYPWDAPTNRLTAAYQRRREAGLPIVDLSISNPAAAGLPPPLDLWSQPAAEKTDLREAIAEYYQTEFQVKVPTRCIQTCASTSEGYSYCFKLLADPGGEVLIPQPSYPLLAHLIKAEGLEPVEYLIHHAAGQWILDRQYLKSKLTDKTKLMILVHPNNPTGHYWSREDLAWLMLGFPLHLAMISDEVFIDYAWRPHGYPRTLVDYGRAFVLSGLSKICALPQMKVGWIVMPDDPRVIQGMELIADTYLSVSAPVAERAPGWLARRVELQAPLRARCLENLSLLSNGVEAGWSAVCEGPGTRDEEAVVLEMLDKGFWIQPGFYYDLPHREAYVVSLLTPTENLKAGLEALSSCGK